MPRKWMSLRIRESFMSRKFHVLTVLKLTSATADDRMFSSILIFSSFVNINLEEYQVIFLERPLPIFF